MKHKISVSLMLISLPFLPLIGEIEQKIATTPEEVQQFATEPGTAMFTPPEGWRLADSKSLPSNVRVMVVGKGSKELPPSMNLSSEAFEGSLKDYLKIVKEINKSRGSEWKDLGTVMTKAGEASLSETNTKTEWGDVRMMHAIIIKNQTAFILTAGALKEEFPVFYNEFFNSLQSLLVNDAK